jgi:O-antigen ligase
MGLLVFWTFMLGYLVYSTRERENALVAAGFLLTFNQYRLLANSGIPFVNVQNVMLVVITLALLQRRPGRKARVPASILVFGVFLTIAYLLTFVYEVNPRYAVHYEAWTNFLVYKEALTALYVCIAAFLLADTPRAVRRIFLGAVFGFGVEVVFCFGELVFQAGKVTGHMKAKNASGAFLAIYAAVCIGAYLASADRRRRLYALCGTAFGVAASLGTRSRGGVLAVGASLLFVSLLRNRIVFVLLLGAAASYQVWMPDKLQARFDTVLEQDTGGGLEFGDTAGDRIEIWKAGLRAIPDYPFGIGFGRYHVTVPAYGLEALMPRPVKNAHNEFVRIIVELGVLGAIAFVAMLARIALDAWFLSRRGPDESDRALGLGVLGGLVGISAASMALTIFFRLDVAGALWLMIGICLRQAGELRWRLRMERLGR